MSVEWKLTKLAAKNACNVSDESIPCGIASICRFGSAYDRVIDRYGETKVADQLMKRTGLDLVGRDDILGIYVNLSRVDHRLQMLLDRFQRCVRMSLRERPPNRLPAVLTHFIASKAAMLRL